MSTLSKNESHGARLEMATNYAILRTAKLKTFGSIGGSLAHTYRTRETANADSGRAHDNTHSHGAPDEIEQALRARLPAKRRKDAVLALEYFVGASPEWFADAPRDEQDAYFRDALTWLEQRHGAENVIGWSIHRDESTPHLCAYVVPLDERGQLCAKRYTGGKATLSKMQTDFAQSVGARHNLSRGIEGSTATHERVKRHYGLVMRGAALDAPELTLLDEMSMALGKPTKSAQKALETRQALIERAAAWEAYRPAMARRERDLERRERAAASREYQLTKREAALQSVEHTVDELKQHVERLEKRLEHERDMTALMMTARDDALDRARAAEQRLGSDYGPS